MKIKIILIVVLIGLLEVDGNIFSQSSAKFKLIQSKLSDRALSYRAPNFTLTDTNLLTYTQKRATSTNFILNGEIINNAMNKTNASGNSTVPKEFGLKQAYPNPFNPETTIEYGLPQVSEVRLTVHNLLGQQVRTIVQREQVAGSYQVRWDGKDDQGMQLPSGIYIFRFAAGQFMQQRKCILLK